MGEAFPLTFQQQAIVEVLGGLDDAHRSYQHLLAWDVVGPLGTATLARVLDSIVVRHPALRTRFACTGGRCAQLPRPAQAVELRRERMTAPDSSTRLGLVGRALQPELDRGFDLERDQLLRGVLVETSDDRRIVGLTTHHLVCDGWSLDIVEDDLTAACGGIEWATPNDADRPLYALYALGQQRELKSSPDHHVEFWRRRLAGYVSPLSRTGPSHSHYASYPAVGARAPLASSTLARISRLAATRRTTSFAAFAAAYVIAVGAWSDTSDIVVATACANRSDPRLSAVVGHFSNTVFLRLELRPNDTFGSVLDHMADTLFDALDHQSAPLLTVVRNSNAVGLYDIRFEVERRDSARTVGSLTWQRLHPPRGPTTRSSLSSAVTIAGDEAEVSLMRPEALASAAELRVAAVGLARLMDAAAADVDAPIARLVRESMPDRPSLIPGSSQRHVD